MKRDLRATKCLRYLSDLPCNTINEPRSSIEEHEACL